LTAKSPFTGLATATLPQANAAELRTAFDQSREKQQAWALRSSVDRQRFLLRLNELILSRQREALDIIQVEAGKSRVDAFDEISVAALVAGYYGKHSAKILAPRKAKGLIPLLTKAIELRHPKGVVGVISPWNYPLALTAMDVFAALAAGNTVVHKPDNQTALSALWLHELASEAGLPDGVWTIVLGDSGEIGETLAQEPDYLCFTGSTATGKKLAERIAGRLIGYSLELGGKNPMIILPDADIAKAASCAVNACFSSAGQLCVSIERIYVHREIRDAFTQAFVRKAEALKLGSTLDFTTNMGSLTTKKQLDSVSRHVEDARSKGARILTGGHRRPNLGALFYEPTIVTDITENMLLAKEETFGPVVALYDYTELEDAISRANNSPYGLNASVFSRNRAIGRQVASRLKTGTVNVNEGYAATFGSVDLPMGGTKDSGVGRRNAEEGLLKYTESQSIAIQSGLKLRPSAAMPAKIWVKGMTLALKALRWLPGR
jgi:succinate-semialdehyde dehydrogenase/glutarate-semialdehyde dehydrogenase